MIVYCVFIYLDSSCEEPIEFPCRLNVGDCINPVFILDIPFPFRLPADKWVVTKSEFFNNASEISQRVTLNIES